MQKHFATRNRHSHEVLFLTPARLARFFDNRDPRDWTKPVVVCATEWVS